jgi:hypothetical protein
LSFSQHNVRADFLNDSKALLSAFPDSSQSMLLLLLDFRFGVARID